VPSRIDAMRDQIHATPLTVRPERAWPSPRRLGLISASALTLAAGAAALVLLVGGGSDAPPAFAAVIHSTGQQRTVTITLREEQDITRLNARLAAEHTRIRVVPVVRGCQAPVHAVSNGQVVPGPAKTMLASRLYFNGHPEHIVSETIAVNTIAGRTLVIADSRSGFYSARGGVIVGPAPSCVGIGPPIDVRTTSG
jgi:hypothetical protein